jgi:hypothetical protein
VEVQEAEVDNKEVSNVEVVEVNQEVGVVLDVKQL